MLSPVLAAATLRETAEAARLAVLRDPNASLYAKTLACKELAHTGTTAAVPTLSTMLLDESLSHPARIALQQIPGAEATQALCNALPDAKGGILIGIIGTLGERREAAAVAHLTPFLVDKDPKVIYATAVALGKIGGADALTALQKQFESAEITQKALLVDGLLACAEQLSANGTTREAFLVYRQIQNQRELPIPARTGAIRGILLAIGPMIGKEFPKNEANSELGEKFTSSSDGEFLAMLEATRDLVSSDLTPGLLAALPNLDADRQALLFDLLDCRGDAAATPVVLAMAKNNELASQAAAIRALAGLPNDEVVEFLLATATGDHEVNAAAAADALTRMKADGLETKIIERLKATKGKGCIPLVQVCRLRKIGEATPVLLPLLADAEDAVRLAVIAALGNTVSGENIEVLVEHILNPKSETEFKAVQESLKVVSHRTVDPDAVAAKLAAVYEGATLQARCALIELFGALGGKTAIDAVQKAVADPTEQIQDTATRILGEWPDPDAAPVLLGVMRSEADDRFKTRALRGYIRIVRQMDTSNEHRFNMCMEALALAKRNEEKLLLVDALGRIPTYASLMKLSEFLDQPDFAEQAATSALNVGRALLTPHPNEVAAIMRKIVEITQNTETKRIAGELLQ